MSTLLLLLIVKEVLAFRTVFICKADSIKSDSQNFLLYPENILINDITYNGFIEKGLSWRASHGYKNNFIPSK